MAFDHANAHAYAVAGALASIQARKARPTRLGPRSQVLLLKDVALRDAIDPETPVGVRASLMRAYVDLHEIDMAISGQGKPKPVEARNSQPRKRPRAQGPIGDAAPRNPVAIPSPQAPAQPVAPAQPQDGTNTGQQSEDSSGK